MSNAFRLLFRAAIAIVLASAIGAASAQTYPSKPIRLIVPLAPGSTADIASRFTANELGKALGQSVVVENKTGAGGTIAMAELARSAADGYTIGFASQGTLVFNQGIYAKPGYDSTERLRADRVARRRVERDDRAPDQQGQRAGRRGCCRQGKAGRFDVLVRRRRYQPPPVRCSVWARDRHRTRARSL